MIYTFEFSTDIPLDFDIGITDWKYKHKSPFEAYMQTGLRYFSQVDAIKKILESQYVEGKAEQLISVMEKSGRIIIAGEGQE